nr:MAG TPA: alpha-aminoadipate carrier protein [Caudoviricetes sp.]DAP23059.1 MAG TPA: alpha-aminoadipate carrier protein [Caudoviricetes sp.]DAT53949.1 MAG TPA: alpha-aminoadipate carrier protein [Caudoviricetes sp.]
MEQIEKIKCPNCGQTLCKLEYGKVEIKCTRCKKIITITKTTDIKTTEPRATP